MNKGVNRRIEINLKVMVRNMVSTIVNLFISSHTQIHQSSLVHCGTSQSGHILIKTGGNEYSQDRHHDIL